MHSLHHHNCIKETKSKSRQQITHDYYHHHQYQTPAIFRLLPATTTATCFSAINSLWNISTSNPRDRHGQQQQQLVNLRSWRSSGAMAVICCSHSTIVEDSSGGWEGVQLSCYISFTIYAQQLILHWLTD